MAVATLLDVIRRNNQAVRFMHPLKNDNGNEQYIAANVLLREAFRMARQCVTIQAAHPSNLSQEDPRSQSILPSRKKRRQCGPQDMQDEWGNSSSSSITSQSATHHQQSQPLPSFYQSLVCPSTEPLLNQDFMLGSTEGFFIYSRPLLLDDTGPLSTTLTDTTDNGSWEELTAQQALVAAVTTFNMALLFHCRAISHLDGNESTKVLLLSKTQKLYASVAQLAAAVADMLDGTDAGYNDPTTRYAHTMEELRVAAINNSQQAFFAIEAIHQPEHEESSSSHKLEENAANTASYAQHCIELHLKRTSCQQDQAGAVLSAYAFMERDEMEEILTNALTLEVNAFSYRGTTGSNAPRPRKPSAPAA